MTIVGRAGGFAERVRCQAVWAIPLPDTLDASTAGPLFCGGITVFNPLVQFNVKPTDKVAVIGIGGLGHMALRFRRSLVSRPINRRTRWVACCRSSPMAPEPAKRPKSAPSSCSMVSLMVSAE